MSSTDEKYNEFLQIRAEDPAHQKAVLITTNIGEIVLGRALSQKEIATLHNQSYMQLESLQKNWAYGTSDTVNSDIKALIDISATFNPPKQITTNQVYKRSWWKRMLGIR